MDTPAPSPHAEEPTREAAATRPKTKPGMSPAVFALLGASAFALGAGGYRLLGQRHSPPTAGSAASVVTSGTSAVASAPMPATPASATPAQRAGALRREATQLCRAQQWAKCAANLDEAAKLDPKGEESVVVQRLHDTALRGTHADASAAPASAH